MQHVLSTPLSRLGRVRLLLVLAIFLGVAVRVGWVLYAHPDPLDARFDDTVFYYRSATALAEGRGYVNLDNLPTAQWPPGYSLLLAPFFKVFGPDADIARIINVVAGGTSILFVYGIARRLFDSRVGLVAAFLVALFPGQIFFTSLVMTETVFTAVLLGLVYTLVELHHRAQAPPVYAAFVFGLALGAAALLRGEATFLILLSLIVWRWVVPSRRAFLLHGGLLLAGAAIVIGAWTVRNFVTMNAFVPIASGTGHTFWFGHQNDPYGNTGWGPMYLFARYADLPQPEREIKIERAAFNEGLTYARTHPVQEFEFIWIKSYHLFMNDQASLDWIQLNPKLPQEDVTLLDSIANGVYYITLLTAAAAAPVWWSRRRDRQLVLAVIVLWVLAHIIFLPNPRYHTPLVPLFAILASAGVIAAWDTAGGRLARARGVGTGRPADTGVPAEASVARSLGET